MANINFPSSPTDGQTYTFGTFTWKWVAATGTWDAISTSLSPPYGPSGAVQYNAAGAFGGATAFTSDGNGNVTIGATGSFTYNPGTANGVVYLNGSKVATSGTALTFDGTNLGVGTSSPLTKLQVGTVGSTGASLATTMFFGDYSTSAQLRHSTNNGGTYNVGWGLDASNNFFIGGSTVATGASPVSWLTVTQSGNLGIGTSSPTSALQVKGGSKKFALTDTAITDTNYNTFRIQATAQNVFGLTVGSETTTTGQVFLDGSGNLGIGVTPSGWNTNYRAFQVGSAGLMGRASGADSYLVTNAYSDGTAFKYINTSAASQYRQDSGVHSWYTAASGTANNTITFTQAMTLDASGNLGVGTSNPTSKIHIYNATNGLRVEGTNSATDVLASFGGNGVFGIDAPGAANGRFIVKDNGEVNIAGVTDQGAYNLQVLGTGVWGAGAYVNGSDARIKEDIAPIDSGLDVVAKLNPVTFKYKEAWSRDRSTQTGFIAQELQTALNGKIYVDGIVQQGPEYMSVAYQSLIPILVKALQELTARVAQLEGAK